jgi:TetR/AcrR family transcriptional regulator, repressor for neighboring sulfatase
MTKAKRSNSVEPTARASSGESRPRKSKASSPSSGASRVSAGRPPKDKPRPIQDDRAGPYGRDQVYEAIVTATLKLWSAKGTSGLTLRSVAAEAGVNYGLVHRHFGTREAVIRAAMDRQSELNVEFLGTNATLTESIDAMLSRSSGAFARQLAWAILQGSEDDILPGDVRWLDQLVHQAADESSGALSADDPKVRVLVGSVMFTIFSWRMFERYLFHGLGLEEVDRHTVDGMIHDVLFAMVQGTLHGEASGSRKAPSTSTKPRPRRNSS